MISRIVIQSSSVSIWSECMNDEVPVIVKEQWQQQRNNYGS